MSYSVPLEPIRAALEYCVGEGIPVYIDGEPERFAQVPGSAGYDGACIVRFDVSGVTGPDVPSVLLEDDLVTGQLAVTHVCVRRAVLGVRVESDQRESASDTIERIRSRIRFQVSRATFEAAGISLAGVLGAANVQASWDGRQVSVCTLDFSINFASIDRDENIEKIVTVNGTNVVPIVRLP